MIKKKRHLKKVLVALCVILIMAYAFIVFLPHSHEFCDMDCTVCAMIESFKEILVSLLACAVVWQFLHFRHVITNVSLDAVFSRDTTPVGLKVKLSD